MPTKIKKTAEDLKRALARLDELWSAPLSEEEFQERCELVDAIETYEDKHVHIEPPSPLDALIFRLEQEGRHEWATAVEFLRDENERLRAENAILHAQITRTEKEQVCSVCKKCLILDEQEQRVCYDCFGILDRALMGADNP